MLKRATAVVVYLLAAVSAHAQPGVLGVWELNLGSSRLPAEVGLAPIKSEIRSYTRREDGYLVVLAVRVNGNGTLDFIQVTARPDSKDYAQYQSAALAELTIKGTATPLTYAETIQDEFTAEIVAKRNGRVINKGSRTISADGRTMTLKVVAIGPGGLEIPFVLTFDRKD